MKKLNGITRLLLLVVAVPVFLWMAAFSKTTAMWSEYRALEKAIGETGFPTELPRNDIVANERLTEEAFVGEIERFASDVEVTIAAYTPYLVDSDSGLSISGTKMRAFGRFIPLLRLLHFLEGKDDVSLSSVSFSKKDKTEGVVILDVEIIQLTYGRSR